MPHFDKDYCKFFAELEKNNNKDWFDENRKRYENSVKKPFKSFMIDLAAALTDVYPGTDVAENFSVMRINRDIRFSKDKTPYKIHMGGMASPYGKKEMTRPSLYVQANHNDIRVYSGSFGLDKNQLFEVRMHIKDNLKKFSKLVNDKNFKGTFGEILGEKNKRLPVEFKEIEAEQPLIANKSFYWFFKLDPKVITSDGLIDELISRYNHTMPINNFINEALD